MSTNPLFSNGEENEKVIRNPHADPDHHQELITSRGAHTCQVWSTSVSAFVSYHVYRMTERMRELEGHSVERMYLQQKCFDGSLAQ